MIAILKTVNCTVHAPLKEKLSELELLYGQYDVHTLCEALAVLRGTFYNHILRNKRGDAWFEKRREEYRVLIRDVFNEYRQVLGAEKIRTVLVQRGHKVSARFVADIMREMGLICVRSTAKQEYLKLREPEKKRNILQQQFSVSRPNEVWVSDVTCFKLNNRYYYVCVILDLFSRKVISYKISKKNSTQLITSTFKDAWELRGPEHSLLFHSDRGAQYTSHRFQQILHEHAVVQSFSNSGKPHDNAVAESFFASFKKEELYRRDYDSEPEFKNKKGMSFKEFQQWFQTEEACETYLFQQRWPDGFVCPKCEGSGCYQLHGRREYVCKQCRRQSSVTTGTVVHRTHLPLRVWFWAIYLVVRDKRGMPNQ